MHTEVRFEDVAEVIRAAFPGATSRRTVKVEARESYHVADYWDGGSRDETVFVNLDSLSAVSSEALPRETRQTAGNPYSLPIADVKVLPGFAIVVHVIFRSKDLGYRVILHPENMAKRLPTAAKDAIDERDKRILATFRGLKSGSYRQDALAALKFTEEDRARLAGRGFLRVAANGATTITVDGKLACQDTRVP